MDGQVPPGVISERLEELMELQRDISFDKNLALVGSRATVLVDGPVTDDADVGAVGRTAGQAPMRPAVVPTRRRSRPNSTHAAAAPPAARPADQTARTSAGVSSTQASQAATRSATASGVKPYSAARTPAGADSPKWSIPM